MTTLEPPEPSKKVRADALERADRAWRARVAGAPWSDAATLAGYSSAEVAMRAVRNVFDALPAVDRDDIRDLWRERVEVLWRQSMKDVREQRPGAIIAAVRVAERAARIDGLDQPTLLSVTPTFNELNAFVSEVLGQIYPTDVEGNIFSGAVDAELVEEN